MGKRSNESERPSAALRILLLCALVVSSFILHIGLRTAIVTEGYKVSTARKELARLEDRRMALRVDRDRLLAPQNLEKLVNIYSREGIDFSPPKPGRLIFERPEQRPEQRARAVRR